MEPVYDTSKLIFALEEEIGNTELFSGRKADIESIFTWAEGVKGKYKRSLTIMARRKKGKTALLQRVYNMFYTLNDEMIIPFYYKVKEENLSRIELAKIFYHSLISQYAAFVFRDVSLMRKKLPLSELKDIFYDDQDVYEDIGIMENILTENDSSNAWDYAVNAGARISAMKDKRIIQIIDEFQYFNEYVYVENNYSDEYRLPLCGTYHHVGASKISPVIISGSYVTLLMRIMRRMTGRYTKKILGNLAPEETLEAIYNYAQITGNPVNAETAAYMARLSEGDPFYIATFFTSAYPDKNLQDMDCIDEIVIYETRTELKDYGEITGMWKEYLDDAIESINNINGKRILLYLNKYGKQERTRKEIMDDLELNMTDKELSKKLDAFIHADIISYGQNMFRYRGPGDTFFDIIFRRMYQEEIESLDINEIKKNTLKTLKSLRGELSYVTGYLGEYKVQDIFINAREQNQSLRELAGGYIEGY